MQIATRLARPLLVTAFLGLSALSLGACAPAAGLATDDAGQEANFAGEAAPAPADALPLPTTPETTKADASAILQGYQHLDPNHMVPTTLLSKAVVYFDQNKSRFANKAYIVVCDFSSNSKNKRFFIINMSTGAVTAYAVAHGSGSDPDNDGKATKFSNVGGSNASSIGFYRTAETYTGAHGYSLRIDGLSATNSNVRSRAIVVHGAAYVEASYIKSVGHAGRSWGCFAVADSLKTEVINKIKGGALIYADLATK